MRNSTADFWGEMRFASLVAIKIAEYVQSLFRPHQQKQALGCWVRRGGQAGRKEK